MAKLPSFQFYPGDWKKDPGVQALSYEERGVWLELLLLMFESSRRGKLIFPNGTPITEGAVARMLGLDKQRYSSIQRKLLEYGVASIEPDTGILYCRRMVRDAELSEKRKKAGKLGGNPNLLNQNPSKMEFKVKQNSTKGLTTKKEKEKVPPHPPYKEKERNFIEKEKWLAMAKAEFGEIAPDRELSVGTWETYGDFVAYRLASSHKPTIDSVKQDMRNFKKCLDAGADGVFIAARLNEAISAGYRGWFFNENTLKKIEAYEKCKKETPPPSTIGICW